MYVNRKWYQANARRIDFDPGHGPSVLTGKHACVPLHPMKGGFKVQVWPTPAWLDPGVERQL